MLDKLARYIAQQAGHPVTVMLAMAIIVLWLAVGPMFHYSDTWQLLINTGTTVITFLMIFLLQHAQNTDNKATHVKLDELIRAVEGARNNHRRVEELPEQEIEELRKDEK